MVKQFPCVSCLNSVKNTQRALQCTVCKNWVHTKCAKIRNELYDDPTQQFFGWECSKCLFTYLPFHDYEYDHTPDVQDRVNVPTTCSSETEKPLQFEYLKNKGLKFVHLNIRSLLRNIDEIKLFLQCNEVHILALNETFLDESIFDSEVNIDNFHLLRKDRNRHGGGVAVYIHNSLSFEVIDYSIPNSLEIVPIMIRPKFSNPIIFLNWYRPPNCHFEIFQQYENLLSFLDRFNYCIVVMGDTNCDILKVPLSAETKRLDEIHSLYSLQHINTTEYTRVTSSSMTLIDHMLTNSPERVKTQGVIHVGISDHSMSYMIWKSKHEGNSRMINFRKLSGIDLDLFIGELSKQP